MATGHNSRMTATVRTQRRYDHRLRELVQTTGDIQLATRHGVSASTARGWLNKPSTEVVPLDVLDLDTMRLQREVIQLRRRVTKLTVLLRLAIVIVRVTRGLVRRAVFDAAHGS
jgi:hypothetical protein